VEAPPAAPIWGATKLTGRLASGLSLGALAALTGEGHADTYDFTTGEQGRVKVEPFTGYGVLRAQQELGGGRSVVGVTLTGVRRFLGAREGRVGELAAQAYTGGADWLVRFRDGEYLAFGYVGGSHVRGSPEAMARLQRSSARYFQRPDQPHVRLDPAATSLSGYTLGAHVQRVGGEHWLWSSGVSVKSPGFELNDAGRLGTADDLDASVGVTWRDTEPGPRLRGLDVGLVASGNWNYGGVRQSTRLTLAHGLTFLNFWNARLQVDYLPRALSDTLTRGGPLMQTGQGVDASASLTNSYGATTRWSITVRGWGFEPATRGLVVGGELSVQPTRLLRLGLEPGVSLYTESRQYVATVAGGGPETFGQRYVFGTVDRRELSVRLRAQLFLTPDLGVELYAEPFASSGAYRDFGELARARGRLLRPYGEGGLPLTRGEAGEVLVGEGPDAFSLGNPDFNLRSLRSNLVVRWEWRPGSTLYVVWQQDRASDAARGTVLSPRALGEGLGLPGNHTFAVKLSWWLPVE
jgi:hypothetical protein